MQEGGAVVQNSGLPRCDSSTVEVKTHASWFGLGLPVVVHGGWTRVAAGSKQISLKQRVHPFLCKKDEKGALILKVPGIFL